MVVVVVVVVACIRHQIDADWMHIPCGIDVTSTLDQRHLLRQEKSFCNMVLCLTPLVFNISGTNLKPLAPLDS